MEELKQRFPADVAHEVSLDTTQAVREGLREIITTLLIAIGLVAIVVFIFLQDVRATLIPLAAVPVSLVGTFAFFPAARLFHQHAVALRPRARDRARGRRRDRRRGSGAASHR